MPIIISPPAPPMSSSRRGDWPSQARAEPATRAQALDQRAHPECDRRHLDIDTGRLAQRGRHPGHPAQRGRPGSQAHAGGPLDVNLNASTGR